MIISLEPQQLWAWTLERIFFFPIILLRLQGIPSPHSIPVWEEQAQTMISFENHCLCLSLAAHYSGREACCSFLALDLWSKRPQLLIQQAKWEARSSWWQFKRWQKSFAFSTKWSLFSDPIMNIPAVDMIWLLMAGCGIFTRVYRRRSF